MKHKFLITGAIMITALVFSAGYLIVSHDDGKMFPEQRAMLVMRDIGHRVLLHAGDSASRILPVKRINESVFQIEFQSRFTFIPDTLVKVVHASLTSGNLPLHYIVNVKECSADKIIYGYQIGNAINTLVPCLGRDQPAGCYTIQIAFQEKETSRGTEGTYLLLIAVGTIGVFTFAGKEFLQKKRSLTESKEPAPIAIGKYSFYPDKRALTYNDETIMLSDKESTLLKIFASQQNQIIGRDRLLKEVWEDEGVFVGRSLDVFVSRLRKKLRNDPAVRIVNIHGKGYKLGKETGN